MIKIDHVTFTYRENNEHSAGIRDIDLTIEDGQVVVLCGESGCGKTTLTRLINGLIPHYYEGKMSGETWVNGVKVSEQPLYDTAKIVGSVFQNPRSQFFKQRRMRREKQCSDRFEERKKKWILMQRKNFCSAAGVACLR